jgi:hypothetical protein
MNFYINQNSVLNENLNKYMCIRNVGKKGYGTGSLVETMTNMAGHYPNELILTKVMKNEIPKSSWTVDF